MINENLDDLETQLKESLRVVQLKKIKQAQDAERANLDRSVNVFVKKFSNGIVELKLAWQRNDIVALLGEYSHKSVEGKYGIDINKWDSFLEKLKSHKNVTPIYEFGVKKLIEAHINQPNWLVELHPKAIRLVPGPDARKYEIGNIIGMEWDYNKNYWTVPLTEAWRLFESLAKIERVVYTDETKEFILKQVEKRTEIDKIALAKNWDYPVSLGSGVKLRNFQNVAAAFGEATDFRVLYALEMGLGKTYISLANAIKNSFKTIIICPASLKNNWAREIFKLTGKKPIVFQGSMPENYDLVALIRGDSQFYIINYDIVARRTEYTDTTLDQEGHKHEKQVDRFLWVDAINLGRPDLIICDESHYIKNVGANRSQAIRMLKSPRMIHMTGTPVLNRPGEIWPILNSLRPDLFPSEELFLRQYTYDGKRAKNVEELKKSLKSIMIRRKQSDVIDDLPPLNRIEDYHELSVKAKKVYKKVLEEGVYEAVAAFSAQGNSREQSITNILVQIGRLKQVCAISKVDSTAELAIQLHDSALEERHNKVLIFSQFKAVAFAIAQRLGDECLCFVSRGKSEFITASYDERDRLVQQFQTDPKINFLVVTEKTAKEGHNITEAGFTIFNDLFWTPASHDQGEGRSYMRINDPHGITSYYRITDMDGDSIEEWIWELLAMKTQVIEEVVEGVEGSRNNSIAMELIEKIKSQMWTRSR